MNEIHVKLGEVLKLERENRKLDLEAVSDQLKISVENIQYVENGEIDKSPSELYFGLFAKSYAAFLGIDYAATLDAIKDEFSEAELETSKSSAGDAKDSLKEMDDEAVVSPAKEGKSKDRKQLLGWIGIGLAVIIIGLLVWILVFGGGVDSTGQNLSVDQASEEGTVEPETKPANDLVANYESGTPPTNAPAPIKFRMIAAEQCWSTVLSDGDTAIFRNLTPGHQYDVEAKYRLMISIALPRVVRTWINDTEVNLRNPETRRISRVEVTQINLDEVLVPREVVEETSPVSNTVVPPAPKVTKTTPPATATNPPADTTTKSAVVKDSATPTEDSVEQL